LATSFELDLGRKTLGYRSRNWSKEDDCEPVPAQKKAWRSRSSAQRMQGPAVFSSRLPDVSSQRERIERKASPKILMQPQPALHWTAAIGRFGAMMRPIVDHQSSFAYRRLPGGPASSSLCRFGIANSQAR
jgi:hypothetical protein